MTAQTQAPASASSVYCATTNCSQMVPNRSLTAADKKVAEFTCKHQFCILCEGNANKSETCPILGCLGNRVKVEQPVSGPAKSPSSPATSPKSESSSQVTTPVPPLVPTSPTSRTGAQEPEEKKAPRSPIALPPRTGAGAVAAGSDPVDDLITTGTTPVKSKSKNTIAKIALISLGILALLAAILLVVALV